MTTKVFLSMATFLLGAVCLSPSLQTTSASANESQTTTCLYEQSFDTINWFNGLKISKDDSSVVDVSNGRLEITNKAETTTRIQLPVETDDFVLEVDFVILSEHEYKTTLPGQTSSDKLIVDSMFGVEYRSDYRFLVHSSQHFRSNHEGAWSSQNYGALYTKLNKNGIPMDASGHGIEHWNDEEGKLLNFNYYYNRFSLNQTYSFRFQVVERLTELYVNDELFLTDLFDIDYESSAPVLTVGGDCTIAFDNIRLYSPLQYAEKQISELPEIEANQSNEYAQTYKVSVESVHSFIRKNLSSEEIPYNYDKLLHAERKCTELYGFFIDTPPYITIETSNDVYFIEEKISLPVAKAQASNGEELFVNTKVYFDGKRIFCLNNEFIAYEAGEYEIFYYTSDSNGNLASSTKKITIVEKSPQNTIPASIKKKTNIPAIIGIAAGTLGIVLIVDILIIVIRRRKQK